ncbi:hypothetical protein FB451DRAFT_1562896 [Mycena latifolia]|nr:hypothetical protein FB451DRAFT_1562896 [Mycena latifolia]
MIGEWLGNGGAFVFRDYRPTQPPHCCKIRIHPYGRADLEPPGFPSFFLYKPGKAGAFSLFFHPHTIYSHRPLSNFFGTRRMVGTFVQILALAAFGTQFAAALPAPALVTVVAPFSPQTSILFGEIAGVDTTLGHTTYIVSDTTTLENSTPVVATVTLVEGSDYLSYTVDVPEASTTAAFGGDCLLRGGAAICGGNAATISSPGSWVIEVAQSLGPGGAEPITLGPGGIQPTTAITLGPGGEAPTTAITLGPGGIQPTTAITLGPGGEAPSSSASSSAPAPTKTPNSSQKTSTSIFGALVGLALAYQLA